MQPCFALGVTASWENIRTQGDKKNWIYNWHLATISWCNSNDDSCNAECLCELTVCVQLYHEHLLIVLTTCFHCNSKIIFAKQLKHHERCYSTLPGSQLPVMWPTIILDLSSQWTPCWLNTIKFNWKPMKCNPLLALLTDVTTIIVAKVNDGSG